MCAGSCKQGKKEWDSVKSCPPTHVHSFFLLWFSYGFKKAPPVVASSILFIFYDYFLEIQRDKVMIVSIGQVRLIERLYLFLLMDNKNPNPPSNYWSHFCKIILSWRNLYHKCMEKEEGSTFVILQLKMRTWEEARVTQESVLTSLSWGPVSVALRKGCPILPHQLLLFVG